MSMTLGLLMGRVRVEEKLIIRELDARGIPYEIIDDGEFTAHSVDRAKWERFDVVLNRSLSHSRALVASSVLESQNVRVVNSRRTTYVCGDKLETSLCLAKASIPQPEFAVATTSDSALKLIEDMGYPVVLKPTVGSWGRLLSKINDRDAAEAILEHKTMLGGLQHQIFYIQRYIAKSLGDIRVFIIGRDSVAAIRRRSEHWITNTARGAQVEPLDITPEIMDIGRQVSDAITQGEGGLLALDLFETDSGLLVNEVNGTMEFRNSVEPTGVNIPGLAIEYAISAISPEVSAC